MSFGSGRAMFATIGFDEGRDDVNAIGEHPPHAPQAGPAARFAALAASGVAESKSEAKAKALLKEWLSSEQLLQYERNRWFEVVGSKTGKRYRIQEQQQQNVYELDVKGSRYAAGASCPRAAWPRATSCWRRRSVSR